MEDRCQTFAAIAVSVAVYRNSIRQTALAGGFRNSNAIDRKKADVILQSRNVVGPKREHVLFSFQHG